MPRAIVLNATDNVATLLESGRKGELCVLEGERSGEVSLLDDVAFGHKVCILQTPVGTDICKYGQVIGKATQRIAVGEHAHVHNIESCRRSRLEGR